MKKLLVLLISILIFIPIVKADYTMTYPDGSTTIVETEEEALELQKEENWKLLNEEPFVTDSNGEIYLPDTWKGMIKIEEIYVPDGYTMSTDTYIVSLSKEGIKITNNKATVLGEITKNPKTGIVNLIPIMIVLMVSLVLFKKINKKYTKFSIFILLLLSIPVLAATGFKIIKVDQFDKPIEGAKFNVYGKPYFKITFDKQGGTGGDDEVIVTYDDDLPDIEIPELHYTVTFDYNGNGDSNTSAISNCKFEGYYDELLDGEMYYDENGKGVKKWDKVTDETLYAKWTCEAVDLPTPTRDKYNFTGWYLEDTSDTKVGDGGGTYTPDSDITLYAGWSPVCAYEVGKTWSITYKSASPQYFTIPCAGTYEFTLAGGQGGGDANDLGGYGATLTGRITLPKDGVVTLKVGSKGGTSYGNQLATCAYGGGGKSQGSGAGGGRTELIYNSIIYAVAAGGGGDTNEAPNRGGNTGTGYTSAPTDMDGKGCETVGCVYQSAGDAGGGGGGWIGGKFGTYEGLTGTGIGVDGEGGYNGWRTNVTPAFVFVSQKGSANAGNGKVTIKLISID